MKQTEQRQDLVFVRFGTQDLTLRVQADADQHIKDAISQIERDQAKRLEELRQQQDLDRQKYNNIKTIVLYDHSEESLVDEAKQLSTKSVIISFDTLKLEFDEDNKGNALFKIALMDEDIKLHQTPTWPVPDPVPIMSLERMLTLRKYEKMQHGQIDFLLSLKEKTKSSILIGIEDIPLSASNPKVAEIYKR